MKAIFCLCILVGLTLAKYDLQKDMKKKHDDAREKHGVGALKISKPLASDAAKCASYYAKKNNNDHSCEQAQQYGENLAWMSKTNGVPTQQEAATSAFDSWYVENKFYDYNTGNTTQENKTVLHFTQLVWKGTEKIGCGTAQNKKVNKAFTCCLYSPPGNYEGMFQDNVFSPDE